MRPALRRLRARAAGELSPGEEGFTIVEMIVAISILAVTMLSLAYGMFGAMQVMQASRHRTAFLELANAVAEDLRALDYDDAGVNVDDPDLATAYTPFGLEFQFNGRDAVVHDPPVATAPPAVEVVATDSASNRSTPYTIRRWVTWTDTTAGNTRRFKRIDVTIDWNEASGLARTVSYSTLYYPGNIGAPTGAPPTAVFATPVPTVGFRNTTSFGFSGAGSTDPNGLPLTYAWDFGDGTTDSGVTASKTFATVGFKTISLVVTNSDGLSSEPVTQTVTVGTAPGTPAPPGNQGPTALFDATPVIGTGPLSVSVDASDSSDPDGDPLTYTWDWGDLSFGSGISAGHVYADTGSYTLILTVNDPAGATSSASVDITVSGTTCSIMSGSFKNPGTNAVSNDIDIRSNDRPENTQFVFTATTNTACTGMTTALPSQSGDFTATLALVSSTATTRTWGVTTTNNSKYNTGTSQSGTFTATGGPIPVNLTVSFSVHV